jgi:hypothetical protein
MIKPTKLLQDFGMPWVGFNHAFVGIFRANVLSCSGYSGKYNKKIVDLHPFVAQRHVQFGTRYQHEREGLVDCEGYDRSKSRSHRICLAAYI